MATTRNLIMTYAASDFVINYYKICLNKNEYQNELDNNGRTADLPNF